MTELADLPATEAARRLRDGTLSATALTEALLDRIATREPTIRAFAWLDPALARRQAAALDVGRGLRVLGAERGEAVGGRLDEARRRGARRVGARGEQRQQEESRS